MDVPEKARREYIANYLALTQDSGNLFILAGDQKIEHLHDDFSGPGISSDDADPEHLFRIAKEGSVGALATQFGLIARYGESYRDISYIVKLNSKTNLVPVSEKDPESAELADVKDALRLKREGKLKVLGIGFTIYLGSEYEEKMLEEAAEAVRDAHEAGLIAVLWAYPRGKVIKKKNDAHLVAGAAGVAATLGADFVKVDAPDDSTELAEAVKAAGRTKVICAGGESRDAREFLARLAEELKAGAKGAAVGRNIHQKDLKDAVAMCRAISSLVVKGKNLDEVLNFLQ